MKNKWENINTDKLCDALLAINNKKEAKNFLRDLFTEEEIIEFGKRFQAAKMLSEKISYAEIVKKTGLSSTTVARVSKWLNSGMNGYKLILNS